MPTSPPTSGESRGPGANGADVGGRVHGPAGGHSPIGQEAEATLSTLQLEGAAFKNWTDEASAIAVRLIEEVKALRWERETWRANEALAARAITELRARTEDLEAQLAEVEDERGRIREALLLAQGAEENQALAADSARADLRAANERVAVLQAQAASNRESGDRRVGDVERGLREELRREKDGAGALQRRLDAARAEISGYERERKDWRASRARLEELRRSWGKQLKKVTSVVLLLQAVNRPLGPNGVYRTGKAKFWDWWVLVPHVIVAAVDSRFSARSWNDRSRSSRDERP